MFVDKNRRSARCGGSEPDRDTARCEAPLSRLLLLDLPMRHFRNASGSSLRCTRCRAVWYLRKRASQKLPTTARLPLSCSRLLLALPLLRYRSQPKPPHCIAPLADPSFPSPTLNSPPRDSPDRSSQNRKRREQVERIAEDERRGRDDDKPAVGIERGVLSWEGGVVRGEDEARVEELVRRCEDLSFPNISQVFERRGRDARGLRQWRSALATCGEQ